MKKKIISALLAAMALLGCLALSGCSSSTDGAGGTGDYNSEVSGYGAYSYGSSNTYNDYDYSSKSSSK